MNKKLKNKINRHLNLRQPPVNPCIPHYPLLAFVSDPK